MRKRKAGIAFLLLGAVLIISALLLLRSNLLEDRNAGDNAGRALQSMQEAIKDEQSEASAPAGSSPKPTHDPNDSDEMKVVTIDGNDYIGYLELPELELELPVIAQWNGDYNLLQIAPCRQLGSTKTDDIVIAAHNYDSHFGGLKDLAAGDAVNFTDMEGVLSEYELTKLETVDPHELDYVLKSGHDLVLYTCTYGGEFRVVAFCDRIEDKEAGPK